LPFLIPALKGKNGSIPSLLRRAKRVVPLLLVVLLWGLPVEAGRWVKVVKVIDGDTVILEDGSHLRYAGINAPELHPEKGPPEPFAREAYLRNRRLTEGKRLYLEEAQRKHDRYRRRLGYLFLPDGRMVSEILVSEGLAMVCYYRGSTKYYQRLLRLQREAIKNRRGIFSLLENTEPYYIGNRKSLRFHRPGCPEARKIRRKRLFNSLEEAFYAGYCPARGCRPWPP